MIPKVSICVPYHDSPKTAFYLSRLLESIHKQTFRDFEIVLTKEGPMAHNHNAAILKSKGEIVQMMQMDDYFVSFTSLGDIVRGFDLDVDWQITACLHNVDGRICVPHTPEWTADIYTGNNRLGSISTLSFKRDKALLFEEPLTWLVDVDLYYRLYLKYGPPNLLLTPNVVIQERADRLTNTLSEELKANEVEYLLRKYAKA